MTDPSKVLKKSWERSLKKGTGFNKTVTMDYRPVPPGTVQLDRHCVVALVPMRTELKYFEGKGDAQGFISRARIKEPEAGTIARQMLDRVEAACKAGAGIVCCSEYSYPSLRDGELRPALLKLSSDYGCYILAGSYVEQKAFRKPFNTALLFAPKQAEPWLVYKSQRGKVNKEKIEVPPTTVSIFCGLHWSFSVMICADLLNDNITGNIPKANNPFGLYKPIDLVLVPARSDDQEVEDSARLMSDSAKACVVYVNDAVYSDSKVFAFNQEEELTPLDGSPWEAECRPILTYKFDWVRYRFRRLESSDNVELHQL